MTILSIESVKKIFAEGKVKNLSIYDNETSDFDIVICICKNKDAFEVCITHSGKEFKISKSEKSIDVAYNLCVFLASLDQ